MTDYCVADPPRTITGCSEIANISHAQAGLLCEESFREESLQRSGNGEKQCGSLQSDIGYEDKMRLGCATPNIHSPS